MRVTAKVYTDGSVETPGIDFGPKGLRIVSVNRDYAVFRTFGHAGWSGRGETTYRPVTLEVVKIESITTQGSITTITGDRVITIDAKGDQDQGERAAAALKMIAATS